VSHLLARWARVDGEETLLEVMLRDCVLERGMAEGDAASVDVLCIMVNLDYDKAASTKQLQHWRKGLLATAQQKSGKPRLLLSYSDGRTKVSRLSSMLPRVADLVIREAPAKLNFRFEELASAMSGKSSADSGPPRTMAQLMLAHKKVN